MRLNKLKANKDLASAELKLLTLLSASIFRSYDIRGIVGKTLTEENIFLIGHAIGSIVSEFKKEPIFIARDGRLSGTFLTVALQKGIRASGCDVIDIGMVPTPLLYYATSAFGTHSGVMLTGSHNPPEYNGLKIVIGGKIFAEEKLQILYKRIVENKFHYGDGKYYKKNIIKSYMDSVKANIHLHRPIKVVIDAGHGVTGVIAPQLYRLLGCDVHELFCNVNGHFPHHHPDPSQNENLQDLIACVQKENADIGLAFDGDGDRIGVVTSSGKIINPDRLLMLFAQSILARNQNAKIIYDIKCTKNLAPFINSLHGEPFMWKTGHAIIKSKMIETNAILGGEMSGHFFFKDRWYGFDDGLYAGARLLEILSEQKKDSDAIFDKLPDSINTPEIKIPFAEQEKFLFMQKLIKYAHFPDAKEIITLDGLRVNFEYGWGLIRASNTSPYLALRFEADDDQKLKHIQNLFRKCLLSLKPDLKLPF